MSQDLRPYQVQALDGLRSSIVMGNSPVLLVAPTGAGKTTIAAAMVSGAISRNGSVLFLAHRKELIDQCSTRLDGAGVEHGVIMSGHPRNVPWLRVQVASIPTLRSRLERGDAMPAASLVIVDEAHRARAATYAATLAAYPRASVVGLTATPWRSDGRGLGELFKDLVVAARPRELIDEGFLVPYTGFAYEASGTAAALRQVKRRGNDYDEKGLELVMSESQVVGDVVQQYLQHANGLRTVVFAVTVKHSQDLAARFKAAGVPAEHVDGETPTGERTAILARIDSGVTKVLCNVNLLTEGWDCPKLECCILARPTMSTGLYLQMVGRVMRPACLACGQYAHPAAESCSGCGSMQLKRIARIHDHARCFMDHGAPDLDREYTLDFDERHFGAQSSLPPLRTCKECFAIFSPDAGVQCPSCGHVNPPVERRIVEVAEARAIPLSELPQFKHASEETKKEHYARLYRVAKENGHRPGAASMKFKALYGCWPDQSWKRDLG